MKKKLFALSLAMAAFLIIASPQGASAHETHIYKIGNTFYAFVVGSLNEPITVDDATGVELHVNISDGPHPEESGRGHEAESAAVTGLDQTVKVELNAGSARKTLDLRPKFGAPGQYTAKFYPTVQTTYTYRFFGTINSVPIDVSFSCNPAGHPQSEDDESEVKISANVLRTFKRGAFGCPTAKADMGFPEPSASLHELNQKTDAVTARVSDLAPTTRNFILLAMGVGVLGVVLGIAALAKKKTNV